MSSAPNVSECVARTLSRHVDKVFALMGNGNAFVVGELVRSGTPLIPVRHEVATVAAADAYYRTSRRLAAATTTYGPGYTNAITALADAAKAGVPLILVTGEQPTTGPRPIDIDQHMMARSVGVDTFTITPDNAAPATVQAIEQALATSKPVIISIPYDHAEASVTESGRSAPELHLPVPPTAIDRDIEHVAELLNGARRPLIVAGRGARTARRDVRELAAKLNSEAIATAPARGYFAHGNGYRDLGVLGGFASPGSAAAARDADVVLVLGAGLNKFTMSLGHAFNEEATVIQVDVKPGKTNMRVDNYVQGEVADLVARLLPHVEPKERVLPSVDTSYADGPEFHEDGRLDPRPLLRRIDTTVPADKVVALDGGNFMGWNALLHLDAPDNLILVGTAFMSIGLGFPSAVGVAAAAGERTTMLLTGDGGAIMGAADLESFIRTAHRGVVVVMNDAAYGAEIHQYRHLGVPEAPMMPGEINFAGMAQALGARASVITKLDDLRDFEAWMDSQEPGTYVLDCRITAEIRSPWMEELRAQEESSV